MHLLEGMDKKAKAATFLFLVGLLTLAAPAVVARSHQQRAGTLSGTVTGATARMDGGMNAFVNGTYRIAFTGVLDGSCSGTVHVAVRLSTGSSDFQGSCLFTGSATVGGVTRAGSAMISFRGKGNALELASLAGTVGFVVNGVHGTGLAGFHGEGSATATGAEFAPFGGSYSMAARFA